MTSQTDQQLLHDYTERGSEAAFAELVRRHIDFVYSAAVRLVRDAHLAEDVSQGVFLALAQNARQLSQRAVMAGWLHRTANNLSANAIRADVRRRAREQEAATMNHLLAGEPDAAWESVAPHLDAALGELSDPDRDALLLRYFQRKSAREMSHSLGISDEAAQKRVTRAIERLRELFARRGIAVGSNGLVSLIAANAVQAAPGSLALTVSTAALAATPLHSSAAIATAKIIAMTTFQKILIATTAATLLGTGIYQARQSARLRAQAQTRSQEHAALPDARTQAPNEAGPIIPRNHQSPRLAALPLPSATHTNKSSAVPFTSTHMYALLTNKVFKLTLAQVEPYLKAKGRTATSLLAAYRTTSDPALLSEALQKFANDPQVGFEAATRNDASPAERRQGLDAFKLAAPDNSLADYLSARAHLKAGETDQAVADLVAASAKQSFENYSKDRIQADEEVYLAAGYPPGEANMIANTFLATPEFSEIRQLGLNLIDLAHTYQQAGDESSRTAALQRAVELGQRLSDPIKGGSFQNQLVGISVERAALGQMEPTSLYNAAGQTVQERLEQLFQQKEAIHVLTNQADPLWQTLPDRGWLDYHEQLAASGEQIALQWLVKTYGH